MTRINDPALNRSKRNVTINPPNGNLHDYIPFYFATRSPTLYHVYKNPSLHNNIIQNDLIYLTTTAQAIANAGNNFIFTDGHGIMRLTRQFNHLSMLNQVCWTTMQGTMWTDTEDDPDRKRRRQAEFLVHKKLEWSVIQGVGVFNSDAQDAVGEILATASHTPSITIKRGWYF